jgi:Ta0938
LKLNYTGCAICDSTWGNVWAEVDGERTFFCCDLCLLQFRNLVERIKQETGWDRIEGLEVAGDRRGRSCVATSGSRVARFVFSYNSEGALRRFGREESSGGASPSASA